MTDTERFIKAIEWLKDNRKIFNNADLAAVLNVSQTYVSLLCNGKKPITDNLVKNLINKFPIFNTKWFLTGEGCMINKETSVQTGEESIINKDASAQSWKEAEDKERQAKIKYLEKELSDLRKMVAQLQEDKSNLSDTIKSLSRALDAISQANKKVC